MRPIHEVLHRSDGVLVVAFGDGTNVGRLGHVTSGQRNDGSGHGGAEQHRLASGGRHRQQLLDVRQEAEVEHLVRLVQHDGAGVRQREVPLFGQINEAAWGADDDFDARFQRLDLGLVGPSAVDREHPNAAARASASQVLSDLAGQFASRGHRKGLRRSGTLEGIEALIGGGQHSLQHRQAEAECLAGAGLGLADDVVAAQGDRQRHRLDGERMRDAVLGQCRDDVGVDVEVSKRACFFHESL